MRLQVCGTNFPTHRHLILTKFTGGGWLKTHRLPSDKGRFGTFDALSQQNQQIIQKILESNSSVSALSHMSTADDEILRKLRGLYSSCMDEKILDSVGTEPLLRLVRIVRRLYRGESTDISGILKNGEGKKENKHGLTAALAFLHSRGFICPHNFYISSH